MAKRYVHLDGLRGIAAVVVVLGHGMIAFDFALYTGSQAHSITSWDVWLSGAPLQIPVAGNLAVCLFFAMSGFVLAEAFDASPMGPMASLAKRYLRLAIPAICMCLLSWLMLRAGWMANREVFTITRSQWIGAQFQQSASFIAAFGEGAWRAFFGGFDWPTSYDSSLWTMQIELSGSIVMLMTCNLTKLLTPKGNARRVTYIILFSALYASLAESYIGLFAAGALIRQVLPGGWRPLNDRPALAVVLVALGLFVGTIPVSKASWPIFHIFLALPVFAWTPWPVAGPYFWHTIGAIMMLVGLQSPRPMHGVLKSPTCQWLGRTSFPLYLIHIPILATLGCRTFLAGDAMGAPYGLSVAAALAIFLPISLACAHILTLTIERPAIRLSASVARKMDSATEPVVPEGQLAASH